LVIEGLDPNVANAVRETAAPIGNRTKSECSWIEGTMSTEDRPQAFEPPDALLILRTRHWSLNHRADSALPGYLMLGARMPTNELALMPPAALTELGPLFASAQKGLQQLLNPDHLYIGRYGHMAGHALHFHLIPICGWVKQSFFADPRYRVLQALSQSSAAAETDGAEMTLYVWREFCENPRPPVVSGPSIGEVVEQMRALVRMPDTTALQLSQVGNEGGAEVSEHPPPQTHNRSLSRPL
jgi:diadenosine tetraphosphate (Ap4A) HIT family hydrolase